jgi:integrase
MAVVSALLGHASIKLTIDTYGHIEPVLHADQLAKAMGRS